MAYNYNDEGLQSKFNAGFLSTSRINKILELINYCKYTPLMKNADYGLEWNFKLWLNGINILYGEIDAYITKDERKDIENLKDAIEKIMEKHSVIEYKKTENPGKKNEIINPRVWKVLKKYFEKYDLMIRQLGIKYNIISATVDDDVIGL